MVSRFRFLRITFSVAAIMLTACSTATAIPSATAIIPTKTPIPPTATAVPPTLTLTPTPIPTNTATAEPTATPLPDEVVLAAGDIASCVSYGAGATAKLVLAQLADHANGIVLTIGDNAYEEGSADDFAKCYDPTWGQFKGRTYPAAGNHDYLSRGARPYFDYFGAKSGDLGKGYYSFELGPWHLIALNSNCTAVGGCQAGSPEEQWLKDDLAAHPTACTLVYWHQPLFNGGLHGPAPQVKPFWDALYAAHADIILNGHDHNYQRFAPQDPDGKADPNGIREFVVGTGGASHYPIFTNAANLEAHDAQTFGVIKLTLHPTGYDWEFLPEAGKTFTDSGSDTCH